MHGELYHAQNSPEVAQTPVRNLEALNLAEDIWTQLKISIKKEKRQAQLLRSGYCVLPFGLLLEGPLEEEEEAGWW